MALILMVLAMIVGCRKEVDEDGDGVEAALDCDDTDRRVGAATPVWPDADGDGFGDLRGEVERACTVVEGYANRAGDCDDADASISPGLPEDCSDVDRDCDGSPTNDAVGLVWYADTDNDGFGDANAVTLACDAPPGHVSAAGDCDDTLRAVNPGAAEVCNGIDDDCDDRIDVDAVDETLQFEDRDGDGFGVEAITTSGCPGAPGWADVGGDCDDTDDAVAPDQVDVCNSGIDDDCDPETDEDEVSGAPWYVDADDDGFGDDATAVAACASPDPALVVVGGDCDDADAAIRPDADEDCAPIDRNCDGDPVAEAADATRYYVDADGDGFGDPATEEASCAPLVDRVVVGGDCDDEDGQISPGEDERCDGGVDNDCDPATTDEDSPNRPMWSPDADGDGFGDESAALVPACVQPEDAVEIGLAIDCDDTDERVNPNGIEICNGGVDDDCDPDTDEEDLFTWYPDADDDGYGDVELPVSTCTRPEDHVANANDCDDADPELNPADTPGCVQDHCGTIVQSETWKNTVTHSVSCDVRVEGAAKPTLTIQGGTAVRFALGTELRVGGSNDGRLLVEGDSDNFVLMTSASPTPLPGDWDGLTIGTSDQGSELSGLIVEYAGQNGIAGVRLRAGDLVVRRLVSRHNINDGLSIETGEPILVDSYFDHNSGNGITIGAAAGLSHRDIDGTTGPSFQRNGATGNLGRPLSLPGDVAHEVDSTNVLTGNGLDEIELLGGTLKHTGTWHDHGVPYTVRRNATIDVQDGPSAELTIADGVVIEFATSSGLRVGNSAEGRLIVEGDDEGVTMTGTSDITSGGDDNWNGLTIGAHDAGSELVGLTVRFGGRNGLGNVYINGSAPVIDGLVSTDSDTNGLTVAGAAAAPRIVDSAFEYNDENGIRITSTSGLAAGDSFSGNRLTGNGDAPLVLPVEMLGKLDTTSSFAGNGLPIQIHASGTVLTDAVWSKLDETLEFLGTVYVRGAQDPVVTVRDGVHMAFAAGARLSVGDGNDGSIVVEGDLEGVVMESEKSAEEEGEGDWYGLRIGSNPTGPPSELRGLTIAHAGRGSGALELVDPDGCAVVAISDLEVTHSATSAIYAVSNTAFSLDGARLADNLERCFYVKPTSSCGGAPNVTAFSNVQCTGSPEFGVWPLPEAGLLDDTSVYPGPVSIVSTTLDDDVRLRDLGVPYQFDNAVVVGDVAGAVLTVQSGARLEFDTGAGLYIGTSKAGGLVLEDGPATTVLTSLAAFPGPGDWLGVRVGQHCSTVEIDGASITYGGANTRAALWFDRCLAGGAVDDVVIESSSTCGVYYDAATSDMELLGIHYADNIGGGFCSP